MINGFVRFRTVSAVEASHLFSFAHIDGSKLLLAGQRDGQGKGRPQGLKIMDPNVSPLERAFELAKTGACASVMEIKKRLLSEGYSIAPITGKTLSKQLVALISQSQKNGSDNSQE